MGRLIAFPERADSAAPPPISAAVAEASLLVAFLSRPLDLVKVRRRLRRFGPIRDAEGTRPGLVLAAAETIPEIEIFDACAAPFGVALPGLELDELTKWRVRGSLAVRMAEGPGTAVARFHHQLRVAALAGGDEVVVWFDAGTQRLRGPERIQRIATTSASPAIGELFVVHTLAAESAAGGGWVHTHGLARFGFPDLEAFALPHEVLAPASWLLGELAERLLRAAAPREAGLIELQPGVVAVLRPLGEALARLPSGSRGANRVDRGEDGAHDGERRAVEGVEELLATAAELAR